MRDFVKAYMKYRDAVKCPKSVYVKHFNLAKPIIISLASTADFFVKGIHTVHNGV